MKSDITLTLPWPPSVNHYWRNDRGVTHVSASGRAYIRQVGFAVIEQLRRLPRLSSRLSVAIQAHPPDKRKRDLDNVLKALLDGCTKAGLWVDDSQLDAISIVRRQVVKFGLIVLEVKEVDGEG